MNFKLIKRVVVLVFLLATLVNAQVNIEVYMTNQKPKPQNVDFIWWVQKGVTETQSAKLNYRFDSQDPNWRWLMITEWERTQFQGETVLNDGLLHLRSMYRLAPDLEWEQFTQKQWSDSQNLSDRFLVGTGLRWTVLRNTSGALTALGAGGMWETEAYKGNPVPNKVRLTTYINYTQPFDTVLFSSTTYFQPAVDDWANYRILNRNSLTYFLFKDMYLKLNANLDYKDVLVGNANYWKTKFEPILGVQF